VVTTAATAWVPNPDGGATPALCSAYFRPDAAVPSQIVSVAWMNQDLSSTHPTDAMKGRGLRSS